jgi:hypothetical protein
LPKYPNAILKNARAPEPFAPAVQTGRRKTLAAVAGCGRSRPNRQIQSTANKTSSDAECAVVIPCQHRLLPTLHNHSIIRSHRPTCRPKWICLRHRGK